LDDVFHVVDVSDTTDSAAGTSKRAKLSDVAGLALPVAIQFNTYEKGASVPIAVMPWYIVQGAAPTVDDDGSKGFRVGTIWDFGGVKYRLSDATTGAAVWGVVTTPNYNLFIGVNTPTPSGVLANKAAFEAGFDADENPNLNVVAFDLSNGLIRIEVYGIDNWIPPTSTNFFNSVKSQITSFRCDFDIITGEDFLQETDFLTHAEFNGNITCTINFLLNCAALTSVYFKGDIVATNAFLGRCSALTNLIFYGNVTADVGLLFNCTSLNSVIFLGDLTVDIEFLLGCTSLTKLVAIERNAAIIQAENDLGITAYVMVQSGATDTFTTADSKTVTVTNGVITSIV
jgi:hypothetical protein